MYSIRKINGPNKVFKTRLIDNLYKNALSDKRERKGERHVNSYLFNTFDVYITWVEVRHSYFKDSWSVY